MPIFELRTENFQVVGRGKKNLNINVPGIVLVFFKMDGCAGCMNFQPTFERLAKVDSRISYGVINISAHRDVARMSQSTTTQIKSVPFIMIYVNTRPKAIYRGKRNITSIQSFIGKILESSNASSPFMPPTGGSGGYSYSTKPGHAGYSGHQPAAPGGSRVWMPEGMKKTPKLGGIVKGHNPYAQLGDVEDEDDQKLLVPAEVTPHNLPWESHEYSGLGE